MIRLALIAVVLAAFLTTTPAAAGTQPVTQCAYGQNPCAGYQAPQPPAGQPDQLINMLVLYDKDGIPAIVMKNAGGLEVWNDLITIRGPGAPGTVGPAVVQLRPDGTILLGGVLWTPHDARFVHCLERPQMTAAACRKVTP